MQIWSLQWLADVNRWIVLYPSEASPKLKGCKAWLAWREFDPAICNRMHPTTGASPVCPIARPILVCPWLTLFLCITSERNDSSKQTRSSFSFATTANRPITDQRPVRGRGVLRGRWHGTAVYCASITQCCATRYISFGALARSSRAAAITNSWAEKPGADTSKTLIVLFAVQSEDAAEAEGLHTSANWSELESCPKTDKGTLSSIHRQSGIRNGIRREAQLYRTWISLFWEHSYSLVRGITGRFSLVGASLRFENRTRS